MPTMSLPPKKRPATQEPAMPPLVMKKPKPKPKTAPATVVVPDEDDNAVFEVSVKLHSRFDSFPVKLRSILEKSYKDTIQNQMDTLQSEQQPTQKYIYNVLIGQCNRPSASGFDYNISKRPTPYLSLANMQLLETFMGRDQTALSKPNFVELKTKEDMANADFIHLHSVRHGELGWGFDTHGCLSLYSVRIVESRLQEVVYFVERSEVKVKDEV